MGRPWTTSERTFIRCHYGLLSPHPIPTRDIAARLGRSEQDVRTAGKRFGMAWQPRHGHGEAWLRAMVRSQHAEGHPDRVIGFRLDCHASTIQRVRRELGLPPARTGGGHFLRATPEVDARIRAEYQAATSIAGLAREMGVPVQWLRVRAQRVGVAGQRPKSRKGCRKGGAA